MAAITTVLFDFDGTIIDTNDVIIGSWQHTFKTLEGKEHDTAEIIKTFGEPLPVTLARFFPNVPIEKSASVYREFQYGNFEEMTRLFPHVKCVLAELKQRGCKLGIVTSRLRKTTLLGLRKHKIDKYFDVIITCEDTPLHKPDPTPINMALERLSSTPKESIMLGDSMFDILCAKNAGVRSVLVGWALAFSKEDINKENSPDFIINKAEELFDILDTD